MDMNPEKTLRRMIYGYQLSMTIGVFARLRLADIIQDGAMSVDEIASRSNTDRNALERLLLYLVDFDILSNNVDKYSLNEVSQFLTSNHPESYQRIAALPTYNWHWRAWGELLHGVIAGVTPFEKANDEPFFEYLAKHPEDAEYFNQLMGSHGEVENAIAIALNISGNSTVIDVGGGRGLLVAELLKRNSDLKGVVCDLESTRALALQTFEQEGLETRATFHVGNFFDSVPRGDYLVLKWILHDWNDNKAVEILKKCREAIAPQGRIFLVEYVNPENRSNPTNRTLDITMFVSTGGKERSLDEFEKLLSKSGFVLASSRAVDSKLPFSIIEGVPV